MALPLRHVHSQQRVVRISRQLAWLGFGSRARARVRTRVGSRARARVRTRVGSRARVRARVGSRAKARAEG